jgi:hypothetical protein
VSTRAGLDEVAKGKIPHCHSLFFPRHYRLRDLCIRQAEEAVPVELQGKERACVRVCEQAILLACTSGACFIVINVGCRGSVPRVVLLPQLGESRPVLDSIPPLPCRQEY